MIGYTRSPLGDGPLVRAMDIPPLATIFFFAAMSFLFPGTGSLEIAGRALSRGHVVGTAYLAALVPIWLLLKAERKHGGKVLSFFRTFYPQLLITPFFFESILLSAHVLGGVSHDAFFIAADEWLFGFQPYMVFYKAFETFPRFNELMFGSYFSYYIMIVTLLWIPWIKGNREETERAIFIYFMMTLVVSVWYVFFRVQGPKYWIPELRDNWYGNFDGFLFVRFFQRGFDTVTLSGAAFPSSHVLFTVLCIIFGFRWDKRLLAVYLPLLALVLLATIYIYAHYVADLIAGLLLSPALYFAFSRLYTPVQAFFLKREAGMSPCAKAAG